MGPKKRKKPNELSRRHAQTQVDETLILSQRLETHVEDIPIIPPNKLLPSVLIHVTVRTIQIQVNVEMMSSNLEDIECTIPYTHERIVNRIVERSKKKKKVSGVSTYLVDGIDYVPSDRYQRIKMENHELNVRLSEMKEEISELERINAELKQKNNDYMCLVLEGDTKIATLKMLLKKATKTEGFGINGSKVRKVPRHANLKSASLLNRSKELDNFMTRGQGLSKEDAIKVIKKYVFRHFPEVVFYNYEEVNQLRESIGATYSQMEKLRNFNVKHNKWFCMARLGPLDSHVQEEESSSAPGKLKQKSPGRKESRSTASALSTASTSSSSSVVNFSITPVTTDKVTSHVVTMNAPLTTTPVKVLNKESKVLIKGKDNKYYLINNPNNRVIMVKTDDGFTSM